MVTLELAGITNPVLNRVDLSVDKGELFVLLGPSGTGKTSLLKVLAGLMPHEGTVRFDGCAINGVPPHKRRIACVFQDLLLFPHMTVSGNLLIAMHRLNLDRKQQEARLGELMEMLKIEHLGHRWPKSLSGGERQRVALARSLASSPSLLLLDEPFSNLDFRSARNLRREFKTLQRKLGLTTVFITHNLEETWELADRLAVLIDGKVTEVGTPAQMLEKGIGSSASFLERVNLIDADQHRSLGNGVLEIVWAGIRLLAPDDGIDVRRFSVLPSRVAIGRQPPGGPSVNRFYGRVRKVIENHSGYHVLVDVNGETIVADTPAVSRPAAALTPGEPVHGLIRLCDLKSM